MQKQKLLRESIVSHLSEPVHNPINYVYMVHGINDYYFKDKDNLRMHLQNLSDPFFHYNASLLAFIIDKAKIEELNLEGVPVKSIHKVDFYNSIGLIIKPLPEDIKVAWYADLSTPVDQRKFRAWVEKHDGKILQPYDLLTKGSGGFNHIVLNGSTGLDIQAITYINRKGSQSFVRDNLGIIVSELASMYPDRVLPVIELRQDFGYRQDSRTSALQAREEFESFDT